MTILSIYQEPVTLQKEKHKNLRLTPQDNYNFAKGVDSVPLNGNEFFEACRDYPIVFTKSANDTYAPIALLSFIKNRNSFIDENGKWNDTYTPAFLRQYPFALAQKGIICIDEKAAHFANDKGNLLFEENGEEGEALKAIKETLTHFDMQETRTSSFCKACKDDDMFKAFDFSVKQGDKEPQAIKGLYVLDEQKLTTLSDEKVIEWHKRGWLAWSYAHLNSLGVLPRLARRQS